MKPFYGWIYCSEEKKKNAFAKALSKIEWTRCHQKRKTLSSRPLSIGRFSSDHRGEYLHNRRGVSGPEGIEKAAAVVVVAYQIAEKTSVSDSR